MPGSSAARGRDAYRIRTLRPTGVLEPERVAGKGTPSARAAARRRDGVRVRAGAAADGRVARRVPRRPLYFRGFEVAPYDRSEYVVVAPAARS